MCRKTGRTAALLFPPFAVGLAQFPPQQLTFDKSLGQIVLGLFEKPFGRGAFEQTAAKQEQNFIGGPFRLAQIMGGHDDLGTLFMDRADQFFDGVGRRRIEAGGRLVEKQHLRV